MSLCTHGPGVFCQNCSMIGPQIRPWEQPLIGPGTIPQSPLIKFDLLEYYNSLGKEKNMTIEKVENGFIIKFKGQTHVYEFGTAEELGILIYKVFNAE